MLNDTKETPLVRNSTSLIHGTLQWQSACSHVTKCHSTYSGTKLALLLLR
nr:MAG TPA: hypothetical protein [Caudoviricetes sp.]DAO78905.1 MAG TPA: hypothetical protein [Caudoviricetes sp.]